MEVLGSIKNRIKTMLIIKRKKLKLQKENKILKNKKSVIFYRIEEKVIKRSARSKELDRKIAFSSLQKDSNNKIIVQFNDKLKHKETGNSNLNCSNLIKKNFPKNNNTKKITSIPNENIVVKPKLRFQENNKQKNFISNKIKENLKKFLDDSKKDISYLKKFLMIQEKKLENIKTEEELQDFNIKVLRIKEKLDYLYYIYQSILNKYDFSGYSDINDTILSKYIDNFKFCSSIDEIDLLVDSCKNQVTYLEELNLAIDSLNKILIQKDNKEKKIRYLNNDYNNRLVDYNKLENTENTINRYLLKEEEYLINLEKEINNDTLKLHSYSRLKFDKNYINNLFKLNIGLSLFDKTLVGAFIGAFLIKNSLSTILRGAFKKEKITYYTFKYQEYINKISDNLTIISQTRYLIKDSLTDIKSLKKHFTTTYFEYLETDTYKNLYEKIIKMEDNLSKKLENVNKLEEKLKKQNDKNLEKQKKLTKLSTIKN